MALGEQWCDQGAAGFRQSGGQPPCGRLSSNKVQCGARVSSTGYIVQSTTVYANPKKVEAITGYPEPTKMKELHGWFGLVSQLQHYVPGLASKQNKLGKLMCKVVTFRMDEEMRKEFKKTKKDIGANILLNNFLVKRSTYVFTDA